MTSPTTSATSAQNPGQTPWKLAVVAVAVLARVVAAGLLMFSPWTSQPEDLSGWDTERFQAIADAPGRPWVDTPVEYPPGSVLLIEAIAADDVVSTNRILVATSLIVDLAIAGGLARSTRSRTVGAAYLLLGLPMVPAGLLRFDLWAAGLGAIGIVALWRRQQARFALAVVAGALVKIFPVLLVPVAIATGRFRSTAAAIALGTAAGVAWLAYGGLDAIDQVLSLRSVTGWHVESLPGSLVALFTDEAPRLEANAFRIGTLQPTIVTAGRLIAVAAIGWIGWRTWQSKTDASDVETLMAMSRMMLGSVAALLITAPLLSPQFLLWLTPWAALLALRPEANRLLLALTATAITLTAVTLAVFGPPNLAGVIPATTLLIRDGCLIAVVVVSGLDSGPGPGARRRGRSAGS